VQEDWIIEVVINRWARCISRNFP